MSPAGSGGVTGLVLAAGGSSRLGTPKQLLPLGRVPLLGHVLDVARQCRFDQLLCVVGANGDEVERRVDLTGVEVVHNAHFGEGCSSSIAAALRAVDHGCRVLVLMLGDQPCVRPETVAALLRGLGAAPLAACAYDDGRGHPLAFSRTMFEELSALHGDKGVWKLLDRHADRLVEVAIAGLIPPDVDTWEDYETARARVE